MKEKEKRAYEEDFKRMLSSNEKIKRSNVQQLERSYRRIDFTKGIAFGLIYGIIGNLFVQFLYLVIESTILMRFDVMFSVNVMLSVTIFVLIIFATWRFRKDYQRYEKIKDSCEYLLPKIAEEQESIRETLKELEKEVTEK